MLARARVFYLWDAQDGAAIPELSVDHERREPDPRDRSGRGTSERGDRAGLPLGSKVRLQAHRHRTKIQVKSATCTFDYDYYIAHTSIYRFRYIYHSFKLTLIFDITQATGLCISTTHLSYHKHYHRNEEDVGNAIRRSCIPREEIFVTTKVYRIMLKFSLSHCGVFIFIDCRCGIHLMEKRVPSKPARKA